MFSHDFKSLSSQDASRRADSLRILNTTYLFEVLLYTHIYWLLLKFLPWFLLSRFLKGEKKNHWYGFFFYKTTSTTKLYAIRVAGIIQYYSDHLGKLYHAIRAIANCIQKY